MVIEIVVALIVAKFNHWIDNSSSTLEVNFSVQQVVVVVAALKQESER